MPTMLPAIKKRSANGAECVVYETSDKDVLFKGYSGYTCHTVCGIAKIQRQYAKKGLAPNVLSGVIKHIDGYGFYVEQVETGHYDEKIIDKLADEMNIDNDMGELDHNVGIKNGKPVLVDFGDLTLYLLGLREHPSILKK